MWKNCEEKEKGDEYATLEANLISLTRTNGVWYIWRLYVWYIGTNGATFERGDVCTLHVVN